MGKKVKIRDQVLTLYALADSLSDPHFRSVYHSLITVIGERELKVHTQETFEHRMSHHKHLDHLLRLLHVIYEQIMLDLEKQIL